MSTTVKIFRNLLALSSCRNVFSLKYCTSQKDHKDSGVKHVVDDNSDNEALARCNRTIQRGPDAEPAKPVESNFSSNIKKSLRNHGNLKNLSHFVSRKSDPSSNEQPSSSDSDSDSSHDDEVDDKKKGSFKGFMSKLSSDSFKSSEGQGPESVPVLEKSETFVTLLRKSPLMELGDPVGKLVVGRIEFIVDEHAYIDFGWKFRTVCRLPQSNADFYRPGSKVVIKIKDLELSTKFLGDEEYTSLLEADCDLICLYSSKRVITVH